ncbi:hypothetical protein [Nonomuraea rubra]|uniref:Uncharacterized protein n=1 Tax=Nonomuraea rubra TaxID=46180 RepID=A0A7X0NU34_9ACTN|nr:hypothetical protein [Nonomuraea rubra]MBB6549620.1 hypothetical protein [Nonomuraea rubra]
MRLRTVPRDRGAVGFRLGPLVMVHGIGEIWRTVPGHRGPAEWEINPRTMWNCGVLLADRQSWRIERRPVSEVPFTADAAPVVIHAAGAILREWKLVDGSADVPPSGPAPTGQPVLPMRLVPYGSARLRVAELPVIAVAEDSAGW